MSDIVIKVMIIALIGVMVLVGIKTALNGIDGRVIKFEGFAKSAIGEVSDMFDDLGSEIDFSAK